jgi:hypothetical protein
MHAAGYALPSFHSSTRAMTDNRIECCKCQTPMQPGYLMEKGHGNKHSITTWARGQPQKSFWMGLKSPQEKLETRTYRCPRCGYLETYAPTTIA